MSSLFSRLSRWSSLAAGALLASTVACGPAADGVGPDGEEVQAAASSEAALSKEKAAPVAAQVNLSVTATGDLPSEGWFIIQAVEGTKPLLDPADKNKRGDLAWFVAGSKSPIYKASVPVKDAASFNLSFVQIENVNHVVMCRGYKHLSFAMDRYLAEHPDTKQLDIDVKVATKLVAGSQKAPYAVAVGDAIEAWWGLRWYSAHVLEERANGRYLVHYDGYRDTVDEERGRDEIRQRAGTETWIDNSTCDVSFAINGVDFAE
jgi:hypothetical protein